MKASLTKIVLSIVTLSFAAACGGELTEEELQASGDVEIGQRTPAISNTHPRLAPCMPFINKGVAKYTAYPYDANGINNGLYCQESRPTLMWSRPVKKHWFRPRPTYEIARTYLNNNLGYVTHTTNLLPWRHFLTHAYGDYEIVGKAHKAMLLRKRLSNGCYVSRMLFVDPLGRVSKSMPIGTQGTGMCGVKPTGLSSLNGDLDVAYAVLWSYPKPANSGQPRGAVWLIKRSGHFHASFYIRAHSSVPASFEARSIIIEGLRTKYDINDDYTRLLWSDGTRNFTVQTYRPMDCLNHGTTYGTAYCNSFFTFGVTTNNRLPQTYANQGWGVHSMLESTSLNRLVLSKPGQARFLKFRKDGSWAITNQNDPVWNTGDTGLTFIGAHLRHLN